MDSEELENWIYSFCYHQPYGRRGSSDSSVGIPYQLAITSHLHIPLYTSGTTSLFFQCFTSKSKKDSRIMTVCYSLQFSALDSCFFWLFKSLLCGPPLTNAIGVLICMDLLHMCLHLDRITHVTVQNEG